MRGGTGGDLRPTREIDMKLNHKHIEGQTLHIEPMVDAAYPNHSAFISVRHDWKDESRKTSYCAVMRSQGDAIQWAKVRGYVVPIGF